MTGDKILTDEALKALFDEARGGTTRLPEALHASILADAADVQAGLTAPAQQIIAAEPLTSRIMRGIGGWSGLGGLVMATAAGVWIGFANPALVSPDVAQIDIFDVAGDEGFGAILPSDTLFFEEG